MSPPNSSTQQLITMAQHLNFFHVSFIVIHLLKIHIDFYDMVLYLGLIVAREAAFAYIEKRGFLPNWEKPSLSTDF